MSILKEIQWLLYKIKKSKNIVDSKFTIVRLATLGHERHTESG